MHRRISRTAIRAIASKDTELSNREYGSCGIVHAFWMQKVIHTQTLHVDRPDEQDRAKISKLYPSTIPSRKPFPHPVCSGADERRRYTPKHKPSLTSQRGAAIAQAYLTYHNVGGRWIARTLSKLNQKCRLPLTCSYATRCPHCSCNHMLGFWLS